MTTAPFKVLRKRRHILPHFCPPRGVQIIQVNPFTNPRYYSGHSSLPWNTMLLLLSLQAFLAANWLALPTWHQAGIYFLTSGTQLWLSQLAPQTLPWHSLAWPMPGNTDSTTAGFVCSLTTLVPWKSWGKKGHVGYRFSIAQCLDVALVPEQDESRQLSILLYRRAGQFHSFSLTSRLCSILSFRMVFNIS